MFSTQNVSETNKVWGFFEFSNIDSQEDFETIAYQIKDFIATAAEPFGIHIRPEKPIGRIRKTVNWLCDHKLLVVTFTATAIYVARNTNFLKNSDFFNKAKQQFNKSFNEFNTLLKAHYDKLSEQLKSIDLKKWENDILKQYQSLNSQLNSGVSKAKSQIIEKAETLKATVTDFIEKIPQNHPEFFKSLKEAAEKFSKQIDELLKKNSPTA